MCGIAGVFGRDRAASTSIVRSQLELLQHRGPDAWGIHDGKVATVGQTRLAVIDLVTGDPPITCADGTIGAALNGEIYNFQSLRHELRSRGHNFSTAGDTEVVAHLAEEHDPVGLASRLHGMFALAICDDLRGRLILIRDRLGKKPLYYWSDGHQVVFGSEIKAVLAHPDVPRRFDSSALPAYLTFGYVPTPRTIFENVVSLPPGHVLVAEAGSVPTIHRYWAPPVSSVDGCPPLDVTLQQAATLTWEQLRAAVGRRLTADVPIGAFLSGGLDSSAVVACMAELLDEPVRTFTIGFEDGQGYDERGYARLVAEHFDTDHVELVVKPEAVDLVERLVDHYDEPFGDASAIPTFLLSELTRQHITVVLSGDGGDEIFAGYERFSAASLYHSYSRLPVALRQGLRRATAVLPREAVGGRAAGIQRFLAPTGTNLLDAYLLWISYFPPDAVAALLSSTQNWAVDQYRETFADSHGAALIDRLLNLNVRTYLLDDLLPKVDRMSMAHGLEVRSPFLDTEFVELALRLPPSTKLRGLRRKRALRAAMEPRLPAAVLRRRKHGFAVPLNRWLRLDLRRYVEGRLLAPSARVSAHLDAAMIREIWDQHQRGEADHGLQLWALLTLEVFLRRQDW